MNRMIRSLTLTPVFAGFLLLSACAIAQDDVKGSFDGLQLVEQDRRGEIRANPDVDWSVYSEIQLQDVSVAFRRNWQRDQNRQASFKVKAEDMSRIKTSLAEQFREVFAEELTKNAGYTMTQAAGERVLTIKPSIVDLDIAAPDTMSASRTDSYTESAGEMTLKLELYDSVSGALLATASNRREAPRRAYLQWTTSASNRFELQRIMQSWAKELRERLDKARSAKAAASAP